MTGMPPFELVSDFGNVLQPGLWQAMGKSEDVSQLGAHIRRLSIAILLVTCAAANVAQAGFGAFVNWTSR